MSLHRIFRRLFRRKPAPPVRWCGYTAARVNGVDCKVDEAGNITPPTPIKAGEVFTIELINRDGAYRTDQRALVDISEMFCADPWPTSQAAR